jgi:hypothetical protein
MKKFFNVQQKEHKSLQQYTKHLKTAHDEISHWRSYHVNKYIEKMTGCDKNKANAFSQFIANMYLDNVDKAKYRTLLTGIHTQTSLK